MGRNEKFKSIKKGDDILKTIIIGVVILIGFFIIELILNSFGISISFIPDLIEWITKFVFPWVVLYWLIRAVKTLEKKG